jgi:thymidine phosphorylase
MCVEVGDEVEQGQPLFVVHANDADSKAEASERVINAIHLGAARAEALPLFYDRIT